MRSKIVKNQAVLFGNFQFPATPDTTVKLVSSFASLGFLPQVLNTLDGMSGLNVQKIALSRGADTQIQFSNDRIDILAMMPTTTEISPFISEIVEYVRRIESGNLAFSRLALIQDWLAEGLTGQQEDDLRRKLLPTGPENCIEWIARWVAPRQISTETYNVCCEVMSARGLTLIMNGKLQPVQGIKFMHDVSTIPENTTPRFNSSNIQTSFSEIAGIIDSEKAQFNNH